MGRRSPRNFQGLKEKVLSDEELLLIIQQKKRKEKEKAFSCLYDRYAQDLLDFFYCRFFGDEEKAKDFLQEIFVKVITQAPLFSENRKFRYWVFRVAANMCKNEYRKQSIRRLHEAEILKSHQENSKSEHRPLLWKKLRKLNDEQCSLLLLRYKYQHSIEEIAQILEIPEGTVKSRLFKCIQDISKNIKNTED